MRIDNMADLDTEMEILRDLAARDCEAATVQEHEIWRAVLFTIACACGNTLRNDLSVGELALSAYNTHMIDFNRF